MPTRFYSHSVVERSRPGSMEETLRPSAVQGPERSGGVPLGRVRQWILIFILLVGLLFSAIDSSIVSTALITISDDLEDFTHASWVVLSYMLAYLGFVSGFAKMSDIFGRRALVMTSWFLFTVFSLGCSQARNMTALIAFRALQGIGASGLYSLAQVCLYEFGPRGKPSLMGALIGLTLATSFVLGPVLGGTIAQLATWRWIFYVNLPVGVLAFVGLSLAWPSGGRTKLSIGNVVRRIDFVGNWSIIAATTLVVFALEQAGSSGLAWDNPSVVIPLTVAVLHWVLFICWEVYLGLQDTLKIEPLFPLRLITQRVYVAALICTVLTGYSYLALIVVLPERFQLVNGDSALKAGLHLLPMLGTCAVGSTLSGALSSRRNNTSVTLVAASCLQLLGVGLLTTLSDETTAMATQYGYETLFGTGVGLSLGSATILTSTQAGAADQAVAQGAVAQARVFGGAIGIAVCGILFAGRVAAAQAAGGLAAVDLESLRHSPLTAEQLSPDVLRHVRLLYANAFVSDVRVMTAVSGASLVAALCTWERNPPPMPRAHDDDGGPRHERAPEAGSETELDDLAGVP